MNKINVSELRYIDLSRPIHEMRQPLSPEELTRGVLEEEAVWPIETYDSYVDDTVCQYIKLKSHVKTHTESPWHLNKHGKRLSDFTPDFFMGRMVHLHFDVPENALITRDIIEAVDGGDVRAGDIVLVSSNYSKDDVDEQGNMKWKIPVLSGEAGKYLKEKGIKLFGQDRSVNTSAVVDGIRPHDYLLSNGVPLLEMLTNLDKLTQKVSYLVAIPGLIKIVGLDSSTTPVIAIEGIEVD